MNTELKNKWVTALRSGEYKQGTEKLLNQDGSRCCLGVLCAAASVPDAVLGNAGTLGAIGQLSLLGDSTSVDTADLQTKLWRMNDVYDESFAKIADYIEANL
jgi:hypothetical protein